MTDPTIEAFRAGWRPHTDLDEHITDDAIRAGQAAAYPHLAATARIRELGQVARFVQLDASVEAEPVRDYVAKLVTHVQRRAAAIEAARPGSGPRATTPGQPGPWRVGNHQPRNLYRDDRYVGVMFDPDDTRRTADVLNAAEVIWGGGQPIPTPAPGPERRPSEPTAGAPSLWCDRCRRTDCGHATALGGKR